MNDDETEKERAIERLNLRWDRRLAALQRPSARERIDAIFHAKGKFPESRRPIAGAPQERQDTKLDLLMDLWDVSGDEANQIYKSAPDEAALEVLVQINDQLKQLLRLDRISVVVRRPAKMLGDRSLIEIATQGRQSEGGLATVRAMSDVDRAR